MRTTSRLRGGGVWAPEPPADLFSTADFGGGRAAQPLAPPALTVDSPLLDTVEELPSGGTRPQSTGSAAAPKLRHRRPNGVVLTSPPATHSPRPTVVSPHASSLPLAVRRPQSARDTRSSDYGSRPASAVSFPPPSEKTSPRLVDSVHNRPPDLFDLRAEPSGRDRQPPTEAYTDGQVVAAKRIIAAANRKKAGRGQAEERVSRGRDSPSLTAGFAPPRPAGLAWSEQLQAELAATAESMRVAQAKLSEERDARMAALQSENRAQLEARLARQAAREAAREQRDTERKMLITAGGMRDQREKLEHELVRLNDQQEELHRELEEQRKRALEAELAAEHAIEEARLKLEQQQVRTRRRTRGGHVANTRPCHEHARPRAARHARRARRARHARHARLTHARRQTHHAATLCEAVVDGTPPPCRRTIVSARAAASLSAASPSAAA